MVGVTGRIILSITSNFIISWTTTLYFALYHTQLNFLSLSVAGEHLTEEFKQKINRFQRVPCINDSGYKLAESVAILRYLSAKGKIPESLYPKYFVEQARVDEFLEWQHITLRVTCAMYFRTIWLDPLLTGRSPSETKIETLRIHMERNLDILEETWLAKSEYLTGPTLTVADIFAACEIEQTRKWHII